ncbi:MAG: hypothetical protein ACP5H2_05995 [Solirubrobacteraceae bacterium]
MTARDGDSSWVEVRVDPETWAVEVGRLREGSPARLAAERERKTLQQRGVPRDALLACRTVGDDGTRLGREFKVYVPITGAPASQRPFAFVFSIASADGRPYLALTAFGERHPAHGTRSVYERAHKRLHGRYPDQERALSQAPSRTPRTRTPSLGLRRAQERGGLER